MWNYLKVFSSIIYKYFTRVILVTTVLVFTIGLFMRWGFSSNNKAHDSQNTWLMQEKKLAQIYEQPVYKTEGGKKLASIQKSVTCSLIGSLCSDDPRDSMKNFHSSFFGNVATLISAPLTHPPASGMAYIDDSINKAGFISKSYAAEGIGFASLRDFLPIWTVFRDFTYFILVVVIILIGFMIMFQYKIDSHTVISVQNSLPRIVVALLTITFSYAIAGLLVDLTYLIILLIFQIFSFTKISGMDAHSLQASYLTSNIISFDIFNLNTYSTTHLALSPFLIYTKSLASLLALLPNWIHSFLLMLVTLVTIFLTFRFANNFGDIVGKIFGRFSITSGIGGFFDIATPTGILIAVAMAPILVPLFLIIVGLGIVLIGILFLYARIFFLLLSAYIQIIINVIFAPLFLITEAIPGQNSFVDWAKKLFAHLLVFPMVITLILVIEVIQETSIIAGMNSFSLPLLYGFETSLITMIISGGLLFLIPDLTKTMIKKIAGDPTIKAGSGLLFGGAGVLAGSLLNSTSQLHSLQKITDPNGGLPILKNIGSIFGAKKGGHGGGGATTDTHPTK